MAEEPCALRLDIDQCLRFLDLLGPGDRHTLASEAPFGWDGRPQWEHGATYEARQRDQLIEGIQERQQRGSNVYYSVNRPLSAGTIHRHGLRGKNTVDDIIAVRALAFDVDIVRRPFDARRLVDFINGKLIDALRPSLLINSGGGFQLIYLLDKVIDIEPFRPASNDEQQRANNQIIAIKRDITELGTNKFRHLFTTRKLNINDKWEKQIEQNSFTRIIINGNAEHIMHVSRTARRLSIWDVNPKFLGKPEYFKKLKFVFDNGGREAFMYYLLHRDISKFDPYNPLYTKETDEQKELSLSDVGSFWLERIEENKLEYDEVVKDINGVVVYYNVIVEKLLWCFNAIQKRNGGRQLTSKAFAKQLRRFVPDMPPAPDVKLNLNVSRFELTPADRIDKWFNCVQFKDLKTCRNYFVTNQYWKHKRWNSATEFEHVYVNTSLWFKGWN